MHRHIVSLFFVAIIISPSLSLLMMIAKKLYSRDVAASNENDNEKDGTSSIILIKDIDDAVERTKPESLKKGLGSQFFFLFRQTSIVNANICTFVFLLFVFLQNIHATLVYDIRFGEQNFILTCIMQETSKHIKS